jgi:hypothetical protein
MLVYLFGLMECKFYFGIVFKATSQKSDNLRKASAGATTSLDGTQLSSQLSSQLLDYFETVTWLSREEQDSFVCCIHGYADVYSARTIFSAIITSGAYN